MVISSQQSLRASGGAVTVPAAVGLPGRSSLAAGVKVAAG